MEISKKFPIYQAVGTPIGAMTKLTSPHKLTNTEFKFYNLFAIL